MALSLRFDILSFHPLGGVVKQRQTRGRISRTGIVIWQREPDSSRTVGTAVYLFPPPSSTQKIHTHAPLEAMNCLDLRHSFVYCPIRVLSCRCIHTPCLLDRTSHVATPPHPAGAKHTHNVVLGSWSLSQHKIRFPRPRVQRLRPGSVRPRVFRHPPRPAGGPGGGKAYPDRGHPAVGLRQSKRCEGEMR